MKRYGRKSWSFEKILEIINPKPLEVPLINTNFLLFIKTINKIKSIIIIDIDKEI